MFLVPKLSLSKLPSGKIQVGRRLTRQRLTSSATRAFRASIHDHNAKTNVELSWRTDESETGND
jgi:hypothetical protein